jgi:cytochrome c556
MCFLPAGNADIVCLYGPGRRSHRPVESIIPETVEMASMSHRVVAALAVGGLALACSVGSTAADDKKDDKVPTIKEIMKKGHAGTKSLIKGIGAQAKAGEWDDAQNGAKTLKTFGEALGKNKIEKGTEESWKKLTDEYKENTKAVADGAEKKDAKAVGDGLKKISDSCKGCHAAHKP